jgi:hypothetical protein
MSWNDMPGLGSATGTRVDSAAKHIMACKVDTRLLACWLAIGEHDAVNALHSDKMKWCMHKDEIVLNTSKNNVDTAIKAYPMVITTVGDMKERVQNFLKSLYGKSSASDFHTLHELKTSTSVAQADVDAQKTAAGYDMTPGLAAVAPNQPPSEPEWTVIKQQIASLPDFRCQGIALGQAWASYLSGDTVASVLVGGMVTVQNGHFTMHTGDLVQWYFDFEQDMFDETNRNTHGCRLPPHPVPGTMDRNKKREAYMDERLYGSKPTLGKGSYKNSKSVVRIKSYHMHRVNATVAVAGGAPPQTRECFMQDHWGDKIRVFAKCISGGRPFDMVDIMLMTQSL